MNQSGNTILITGGGSGIGRALAHRFNAAGNKVIVAGRRLDALHAAIDGRSNMHVLEFDITNAEGISDFTRRLLASHPDVNVLINNAGIMRTELLDRKRDLSATEAMIATNLLGPIRLTNALIDHLAHQRGATIINVSSGLAFVPLVTTPTYNATKAAIHSYTMSLRQALAGHVEVIELVPPAVQTGLTPGQETREGYLPLEEFIDEVMTLFALEPTPPEILVERVGFLRNAEREGRLDQAVMALNAPAPDTNRD